MVISEMSSRNNVNILLAAIVLALFFLSVIIIVPKLINAIEKNDYEIFSFLLIWLGFSAVIFFLAILFYFLRDNKPEKKEKYEDVERIFRNRLKHNRYFSSPAWQMKYREYVRTHPLKSLNSSSITVDLLMRNIIKSDVLQEIAADLFWVFCIFNKYGGVPGIIIWTILLITRLKNIMSCISSFTIFSRWMKNHPEYSGKRDEIIHSYLNGYAFECSCFCLVIGPEYIHAYDGKSFHTVRKENIVKATPVIDHILRKSIPTKINYYHEYQFKIKFIYTEDEEEKVFLVTLDQFQVMMIMMQFFPDLPSDNPLYTSMKEPHDYISVDNNTSALVLDRNSQTDLSQEWL